MTWASACSTKRNGWDQLMGPHCVAYALVIDKTPCMHV